MLTLPAAGVLVEDSFEQLDAVTVRRDVIDHCVIVDVLAAGEDEEPFHRKAGSLARQRGVDLVAHKTAADRERAGLLDALGRHGEHLPPPGPEPLTPGAAPGRRVSGVRLSIARRLRTLADHARTRPEDPVAPGPYEPGDRA